jgi:hypothetical protein
VCMSVCVHECVCVGMFVCNKWCVFVCLFFCLLIFPDTLNKRSNQAAINLGFTYEGTLRQLVIIKGISRDGNYYSILNGEWKNSVKAHLQKLLLNVHEKVKAGGLVSKM